MGVRTGWLMGGCLLAASGVLVAGCVSGGQAKGSGTEPAAQRETATKSTRQFPSISLDTADYPTLGAAFRHIGETSGGSAVLMSGMEDLLAPPSLKLQHADFVQGVQRLLTGRDCRIQATPAYLFIYPAGYEQLEALSLVGQVDPALDARRATFALGAGTDLYNGLALLSTSLNTTIAADNLLAEVWCGELFLEDASISTIVEAMLKSARVTPGAVSIQSTGDYLFLRSAENGNRADACLGRGALTPEQQALLQRRVSFRLPYPAAGPAFESGPRPLSDVLPHLSSQLGIPVSAEPALASLLVNAAVINQVPLETALNLIVWQWPLAQFGYRVVDGNGIQFCLR
jgi:hypothetical protein